MVFGEVQCVEVVLLGLGLGADHAREAELFEDVADLVDDLRDDVQPAAPLAPARQRDIDAAELGGRVFERAFAIFDRALELALQGVRSSPDLFTLVGLEAREGLQDLSEGAGLTAEKLSLDLLEPSFVGVRDLFEIFPQRF